MFNFLLDSSSLTKNQSIIKEREDDSSVEIPLRKRKDSDIIILDDSGDDDEGGSNSSTNTTSNSTGVQEEEDDDDNNTIGTKSFASSKGSFSSLLDIGSSLSLNGSHSDDDNDGDDDNKNMSLPSTNNSSGSIVMDDYDVNESGRCSNNHDDIESNQNQMLNHLPSSPGVTTPRHRPFAALSIINSDSRRSNNNSTEEDYHLQVQDDRRRASLETIPSLHHNYIVSKNKKNVATKTPLPHETVKRKMLLPLKPATTITSLSSRLPNRLELGLFGCYFCNTFVLTLPVVFLPLLASEHITNNNDKADTASADEIENLISGFVASIASVATVGGGIGKVLNGFVCQVFGSRYSSIVYLGGMTFCSLFLSTATSYYGILLAGLEFFASIQWTSCTVILCNHYGKNSPEKLAAGITMTSFAGTLGTLTAKVFGTLILQHKDVSWRFLVIIGSTISLLGSFITQQYITEFPTTVNTQPLTKEKISTTNTNSGRERMHIVRKDSEDYSGANDCGNDKRPRIKGQKKLSSLASPQSNNHSTLHSIKLSLQNVLYNRLFWQVGFAHAMSFLARVSDRILGTYYKDITGYAGEICGGLTACIGIGFIHGLVTGKSFNTSKDITTKTRLLSKRYSNAVIAALGLALCASPHVELYIGSRSKLLLLSIVALLSFFMASSLSIQFYLLTPIVANTFGQYKAVCLSFLDAVGFFIVAPVLATTSYFVKDATINSYHNNFGWIISWIMVAVLFGSGGYVMMKTIPPVLCNQIEEAKKELHCKSSKTTKDRPGGGTSISPTVPELQKYQQQQQQAGPKIIHLK